MKQGSPAPWFGAMPFIGPMATNAMTMMNGVKSFFETNPRAHFGMTMDPETASYYSTAPLEKTLTKLIDINLLNTCQTRLTVGAANVRTAGMHCFDSRDAPV